MAWNPIIHLIASGTLADETSTHTVQFQPIDQAFSTGAVAGTQGTSNLARYVPSTALDTTKNYDVHIDSVASAVARIYGPNTVTLPSE